MARLYRDSLLSLLCVLSFVVISGHIIKAYQIGDNHLIRFLLVYLTLTVIGFVGGAILIFLRFFKKGMFRYSFLYNLFATFNIIVGVAGFMLPQQDGSSSSILARAGITIGIVMYAGMYNFFKFRNN